jgi:TRAP-type C4-dicarboxylate transport system permease small subunit
MVELSKKNLFDKIVVGALSVVLVVNSLAMTVLIVAAAAARYIFKVNFNGYDEIAVLIAFWLYFMGAAYGAYNNSHVTADIVDAYFPPGTLRGVLTLLRSVVTCAACGLFVYYGFGYFKFSYMGILLPNGSVLKPTSMVWRIPHWITHLGIFSGLIVMEIYFLRNLVISVKTLVQGSKA